MNITAIIPARGGSKRLPRKNIALLNGKPLISYTISAWAGSKYADSNPIVSTNDDEIAKIARQYGAEVIKRPPGLSQGDLPSPVPILWHVINHIDKYKGYRVQWIVLLQPTSPLRLPEDIDACLDAVNSGQYDSATSVCEGKENGAVYVTHANLINQGKFLGERVFRYEMPRGRSVDIDTQADLDLAEKILKGEENDYRGGNVRQLENTKRSKGNDKGRP